MLATRFRINRSVADFSIKCVRIVFFESPKVRKGNKYLTVFSELAKISPWGSLFFFSETTSITDPSFQLIKERRGVCAIMDRSRVNDRQSHATSSYLAHPPSLDCTEGTLTLLLQ